MLEQSLAIANKIAAKTQLSSILSSLGKNASDLQDPEAAFDYFEQAEKAATNPNEELQARLARFKLLVDYDKLEYAIELAPQLRQQLEKLPPSHTSLYAAINFVATLNRLPELDLVLPIKDLAQLMAATVKSAQQIEDATAEAYALYQWGQLYRRTQQWSYAKELAQKSLNIARQLKADDIIAQSAWQVAHEMNNPLGFISASLKQAKPNLIDIIEHLKLYQESFPVPSEEIINHANEIDLV